MKDGQMCQDKSGRVYCHLSKYDEAQVTMKILFAGASQTHGRSQHSKLVNIHKLNINSTRPCKENNCKRQDTSTRIHNWKMSMAVQVEVIAFCC